MLERTSGLTTESAEAEQPAEETPRRGGRLRAAATSVWRFFITQSFSSLTRRIVILNLVGLIALLTGVLYLSQFRAGLIDARVESLLVQGEIIAGAIAASATVDANAITIDPERLLELQAGESYGPPEDALSGIEFPINPERVAPVLRRLVSPTRTRARIYDRDGVLILDSRSLYGRGDILRFDLPAPGADKPGLVERFTIAIRRWFSRGDLPLYKELGADNGKGYPEVERALAGLKASMVRINERGEVIVSVAVPVQRFRAVRGALMLSTQGADIDQMVEAERLAILKVFLVAAAVMVVLSMLLAGTIAGPVRRLADGAERVRRRIRARVQIPDFTRRNDEIGELKNPLTSLRSAVETLPLAKTEESRNRLLGVIMHDVQRLNRLISDISDASRLDAELQRQEAEPVDLRKLLEALVTAADIQPDDISVTLAFQSGGVNDFRVPGHDSRLAQVFTNLIENARSFSPPGGTVRVTGRRLKNHIDVIVDDDGPGIRPDALDKIFERFYTDRPHQGFGQNSGLGLSISRQIIEAHGGRIHATNRIMPPAEGEDAPRVLGARFIVQLPAM